MGEGLRSRADHRRATEAAIAVQALNRMLELGSPKSLRTARSQAYRCIQCVHNSIRATKPLQIKKIQVLHENDFIMAKIDDLAENLSIGSLRKARKVA
jgi:hypothetical protein